MAAGYAGAGRGAHIIAATGLLGAIVSLVNYFAETSGIDGTGGALLVIITTLLILVLGWLLRRPHGASALLSALCLILLLGTAFAAWLLNSPTLLALMAIGCVGWLLRAARKEGKGMHR